MCNSELRPIFADKHQETPAARFCSCALRTVGLLGILLVLILLSAVRADASPLSVKVVDRTGAAFPNVLVIVKSLEGKGEIFRALTDAKGIVPSQELPSGLYRVIATCPYGICETKVEEFYVKDVPVQLELTVDVSPTHGEGDVIEVGPSKQLKVQVTDSAGRPVQNASVLIRDSDALHERWYKTDSGGSATVKLPEGSVTVDVLYDGNLTSKTFNPAAIDGLRAKGAPLAIQLATGPGAPQGASVHTNRATCSPLPSCRAAHRAPGGSPGSDLSQTGVTCPAKDNAAKAAAVEWDTSPRAGCWEVAAGYPPVIY